ncbi:MAG: hypothetical protein EG825_10295 [Rhodocyclaceae bacterium]|nr:hypothetical protein [Rhodocyclaceae bacterium]
MPFVYGQYSVPGATTVEPIPADSGAVLSGATMDPMTGALINAGSSVLSKVLGGGAAPAQSGARSDSYTSAAFDNSGWNVNFGGGTIESSAAKGAAASWGVYAALAVGVVVLWKLAKNK